jgi:hypothetical protein
MRILVRADADPIHCSKTLLLSADTGIVNKKNKNKNAGKVYASVKSTARPICVRQM